MEREQELEWLEAQKITISTDLVASAKRQLKFLAEVDRRRWLYEGPYLDQAINRYKTCWLPLLAKFTKLGAPSDCLVVPLDCEWIWHCHRLNPVQYKKDCDKVYGRILDTKNVVSSLDEHPNNHAIDTWNKLYPEEPFELECSSMSDSRSSECSVDDEAIKYDFVSAVKRQSSFYFQVARPTMSDDRFLEDALCRYKGFLHLIKRNQEKSMKRFCVPTYDIDLVWHSHQLQPFSYCNDMEMLLGRILDHDDTDSDRSKGKKLDTGFTDTTMQYEDTFGLRYWRAGATFRGTQPSPLTVIPELHICKNRTLDKSVDYDRFLSLPQRMSVEVLLEIVRIKNLPAGHRGDLFVSCTKKHPDNFFGGGCTLSIYSEAQQKMLAGFKCEPSGELVLALMSKDTPYGTAKTVGITSIPLGELTNPKSELAIEKWFELKPPSGNTEKEPIRLHVAASFTAPVLAPNVFHMIKSHLLAMDSCFFPLSRKPQLFGTWTRFIDMTGNEVMSLKIREHEKKNIVSKEIIGVSRLLTKPRVLAEYTQNVWKLKDFNLSLHVDKETSKNDNILELSGEKQVKVFRGRRLEYERRNKTTRNEQHVLTVIEFSSENPYGKAVGLLDIQTGLLEVNEEWFTLPAMLLTFIFSKTFKKKDYGRSAPNEESGKEITNLKDETSAEKFHKSDSTRLMQGIKTEGGGSLTLQTGGWVPGCGGSCWSLVNAHNAPGCGSGCGNIVVAANTTGGCGTGCGGGCGSGCGNFAAANTGGGCGSGCGGSCGNIVIPNTGGGCGGGCSGSCGNAMLEASKGGGCGSGCGGSCGNAIVAATRSGGGCGSGCGSCGAKATLSISGIYDVQNKDGSSATV